MDPEHPVCSYFMFINSGSGGGVGQQMLGDEVQKFELEMELKGEELQRVDAYMYNLKRNRDKGFRQVKKLNDNKQKTVVIICGGDGSVMWVISEFVKYGINPEQTPLAIIPLGTGNDFSRSLGWGGSAFLRWSVPQLKILIRMWADAEVDYFDLWDVEIDTFENGYFSKVEKCNDVVMEEKVISKTFCNYFSFGVDGKVGYSFDKYRTNTRLGNLAVYGAVGAITHLQKTKSIDQLVETLYTSSDPNSKDLQKDQKLVFLSRHAKNPEIKLDRILPNERPFIKEGQMNILALNIDSYTGGTTNIWKNAKQMLPRYYQEMDTNTSASDGVLEIVSFDSAIGIAVERIAGGLAKKVVQSAGPFRFNFIRYNEEDHHTFLQIDGEFLKVGHPKTITIRRSRMVPGGKVKVLRNNKKWDFEAFINEINKTINMDEMKNFSIKNLLKN